MASTATITRDPARIRALFTAFFERLFTDPALRGGFTGVGKTVEMRYTDPPIVFVLDLRGEPEFRDVTESAEEPSDIQVQMAWETAHDFWKDDLDVIMAFISQRIKASGATEALLHLRPHFKSAAALYGGLAQEFQIEGGPDRSQRSPD